MPELDDLPLNAGSFESTPAEPHNGAVEMPGGARPPKALTDEEELDAMLMEASAIFKSEAEGWQQRTQGLLRSCSS